jgi:hypothetical protein
MECANHWQVLSTGADGDYREARADDSGVGALIEEHRAQPLGSEVISMSAFDALNEPVQAQAAQLVTHAARTDVVFFQAEHLRK